MNAARLKSSNCGHIDYLDEDADGHGIELIGTLLSNEFAD
jgi:hypothetical protein